MKRKILSVILALAMALSLLPTVALADGGEPEGELLGTIEEITKVGTADGSSITDTKFTGRYQIESSMFGKRCVELTLKRQFPCFPGDTVLLTCSAFGINKSCRVIKTHCWADAVSAGTSVTLEV